MYDARGYFWPVKPPTGEDPESSSGQALDVITHTIAGRVTRYLEKTGYLVRDVESAYLDYRPDEDDAMSGIISASVTYRLAFGPHAGQKALTLQTVPASDTRVKPNELVSKQAWAAPQFLAACGCCLQVKSTQEA